MDVLHHRDGDTGSILYTAETEVMQVLFRSKDCKLNENPQHGDIVSAVLIIGEDNQVHFSKHQCKAKRLVTKENIMEEHKLCIEKRRKQHPIVYFSVYDFVRIYFIQSIIIKESVSHLTICLLDQSISQSVN